MKAYRIKVHRSFNNKPMYLVIDSQKVEVTTWYIFYGLQKNLPVRTLEEAKQARLLIEALNDSECKDTITIEESVYDWIKNNGEAVCAQMWRENALEVFDYIVNGALNGKKESHEDDTC